MTLFGLKETEKSPDPALTKVHPDCASHEITWGRRWSRRSMVAAVVCVLALLVVTVAILLMAIALHNNCDTLAKAPRPELPPDSGITLDYQNQVITVELQNLSHAVPQASVLQDYKKGTSVVKDLIKNVCFVDKLDQSFDDVLRGLSDQQWDALKLLTKNFKFDGGVVPDGALGRLFGWRIQEHCKNVSSHLIVEETDEPGGPSIACQKVCTLGFRKDFAGRQLCECKENDKEPPVNCPPVCRMFCQFGNEVDDHGCAICRCKMPVDPKVVSTQDPRNCPPTCRMVCLYGFVKDQNGCDKCECAAPSPSVNPKVVCQPSMCRMMCDNGFAKDANGCDVCECKFADYPTAVLTQDPRNCPPTCRMVCLYGFVKDQNGCDKCECAAPPAATTAAPVLPDIRVVTPSPSCGPQCRMLCQYGFEVDATGCPICKCRETPATAGLPDDRALATPEPGCPPLCRMLCAYGFQVDQNGCPTCRCRESSEALAQP